MLLVEYSCMFSVFLFMYYDNLARHNFHATQSLSKYLTSIAYPSYYDLRDKQFSVLAYSSFLKMTYFWKDLLFPQTAK